ncbi:MAG: 1-deoxy-D-xylulose-5-phosphate synthase [Bacteroidetes bacterium]|nr:1-deoxy-D-xylulose-5-phosphate synthase [Bacteroidota bacterium]
MLPEIHSPEDLRKLNKEDLPAFRDELRKFLIEKIREYGGHFSANLGTVELTIVLHYVFNTPEDQLVWDVGHQSYGHKVLTGRKELFHTIRKKEGISGFPNPLESEYDVFVAGHSSTSISAALGMAEADRLLGIKRKHIAVIGDGSLTAGMAWEALNNAAVSKSDLLIIINDNQMGIDPNQGGLGPYLAGLKSTSNNFFSDLGFQYFGPDDGHNLSEMLNRAEALKQISAPVIWHIRTIKGKGFPPAEAEQTKWHAVKYAKVSGDSEPKDKGIKFQEVFGQTLTELARIEKRIVAVTPAMPTGSSLTRMMAEFPDRVFDVGIAEQHAVTFSAGLAKNGLKPYCCIYSTFLQRGFDQVIHDVCIQKLPVVLCIDRAGAVGEDGVTHQGIYDIAFLRCIPNLIISAPSGLSELKNLLFTAKNIDQPIAIRYPKDFGTSEDLNEEFTTVEIGKGIQVRDGKELAILNFGPLLSDVLNAAKEANVAVFDMRFAKPIDRDLVLEISKQFKTVMTIEDGCIAGGFGSAIGEELARLNYTGRFIQLGYPDEMVEHANRSEQLEQYGLSETGIRKTITDLLR